MNRTRSGIAAGVVVAERSIRYAAVNYSEGRILDRLGSCDFDFDVIAALNSGVSEEEQRTLSDAVNDVLGDSGASSLTIGIHPALAHTFYSLSSEDEGTTTREQQFRYEGQLLFGDQDEFHAVGNALHHVVKDGSSVNNDLYMVTLVPSQVKRTLDAITDTLSIEDVHFVPAVQGVQQLVHAAEISSSQKSAFSLLVGQYRDQVVMSMMHHGTVMHGQTVTPKTSEDYLYWAIVLATRLDVSPTGIGRIYLYGDYAQSALLEDLRLATHAELTRVDPFVFSDLSVGHIRPDFDSSAYASCIGIVL